MANGRRTVRGRSVYLVGMMGSGKSTIGRHLAEALHYAFEDADQVVEQRAGVDVNWIFDREGECGFRDREQHAVEELTLRRRLVLATGGGAVLREANRRALRERGLVVFLDAPKRLIIQRMRNDHRRPLLAGGDLRQRIDELCEQRLPLYASVAHVRFRVDARPPQVLADRLATRIKPSLTRRGHSQESLQLGP